MTLVLDLRKNMKCMVMLTICLITLGRELNIIYIWISETTNGKKDLVKGNNNFIYQRMG